MATVAPAGGPTAVQTTTHPFTCNTCQVAFRSSEGQRNHMHTDWHRYNLKRRVAELPPISAEIFAEKVLSSQADSKRQRERASFERLCQPCGRTYYSENAFNNHINSSKHKFRAETLMRAGFKDGDGESLISSTFSLGEPVDDATPSDNGVVAETRAVNKAAADEEFSAIVRELKISDKRSNGSAEDDGTATPKIPKTDGENKKEKEADEEDDDEEGKSIPVTTCLFCTHSSLSLQQNLDHMSRMHGLFIPEQRYLVDLEGLIRYLGEKVAIGHTCIFCNKGRGGLEGVRTHMRDKGHCMVAFDSEDERLEIGEFYDFRSTYEDEEGEEDEEGRAEGWETDPEDEESDDDDSTVASEDISYVPVDEPANNRIVRRKSHRQEDGWHSHAHSHSHTHAIYYSDYELHLPSGKSVGHRSLARYYKQNLRDSPYTEPPQHRLIEDATSAGRKPRSAALTRAAGGAGLAHATPALRTQALKLERKDRKTDERIQRRLMAASQFRANNQKHFRDPILGKTG